MATAMKPKAEQPIDESDSPLRRGFAPRYRQIEAILRDQIWAGELAVGDQVPPEEDLTRTFGVSRATVRQALQMLEHDGLIQREPGRGTFVRAVVEQLPQRLISLTPKNLVELEVFDQIILHRTGTVAARGEIQDAMQVGFGAELFFFVRIFLLNDEPIGAEKVYVPPSIGHLLSAEKMIEPNIVAMLSRCTERKPAKVERRIGAHGADIRTSVYLDTPAGTPQIAVHRTTFDDHSRPLEHSHIVLRHDRCQISLDSAEV